MSVLENLGSGLHVARGAAKRELGGVKITGIVGNTKKTPLDECGRVYKDLDEVLRVLASEGIAKVAHRMYPVANMKGMD